MSSVDDLALQFGDINIEDTENVKKISPEESAGLKEDPSENINKQMLFERLSQFAKDENANIRKEKELNKNLPFAFLGMGELGEELCLYMFPNSYGMASKGGIAFDNLEYKDNANKLQEDNIKLAREIKFVSLDGSKICKNCENKAPRFQDICILCGNDKFKLIKDSRAGIKAKEHFTYKDVLKEYIIFVSEFNDDTAVLNLKCFRFYSDNEYFNGYLQHIKDNTQGGNANFLPFSYDWYLSGPIVLFDLNIDRDGNVTDRDGINYPYNLENQKHEPFPTSIRVYKTDTNCFTEEQKQEYDELLKNGVKYIEYEKAIELFKIRNKKCGKSRGTVTRKIKGISKSKTKKSPPGSPKSATPPKSRSKSPVSKNSP